MPLSEFAADLIEALRLESIPSGLLRESEMEQKFLIPTAVRLISRVRKLPERKPRSAQKRAALEAPGESLMTRTTPDAVQQETSSAITNHPAEVKPLAPERYKVQFTVSRETYERLRQAQDLLRHTIPNGDPAAIFERALTLLVTELEKSKLAAAQRPRLVSKASSRSRHIPANVKRVVWKRDGARCAFQGALGRCAETGFLEFHHVVAFAAGGETTAENLELRCRAHNAYEAERDFGSKAPPLLRERCESYGIQSIN